VTTAVEPAVADRLEAALIATRLATADTLRWFCNPALEVEQKADLSPVTLADRAAEAILRTSLLNAFPEDAFLGEESGVTSGTSGYEWVVDPIDGTKSFIRGVPLYATLVGCRRGGVGVLGVIAIPALDEWAYAAVGGGAWHVRGSQPPVRAAVSCRPRLAESLVCSSDFVDFGRWPEGHAQGAAARRRLESSGCLTRTWGDGYGYLLVATGRAEAMIDPRLNAWDAAAVDVVVREAGGRFSDWYGTGSIDSGHGVATNGVIHDEVIRTLLLSADEARDA
jgi:histidinol phosphatase-like enzyme (inositol monophosphatase family)